MPVSTPNLISIKIQYHLITKVVYKLGHLSRCAVFGWCGRKGGGSVRRADSKGEGLCPTNCKVSTRGSPKQLY